ncbi:MAG: 2-hydroxyacid dehydrogenase [Alphaproteobacteria bacterium]|nr:2-hydroxyacid dehydrogenase [Alphaproteobacteria bacterium]
MPNKVVIPSAGLAGLGRFLSSGIEAVLPSAFPSLEAMSAQHGDVTAAIVMGGEGIGEGMLRALPKLSFIQTFGAGYDGLDIASLRRRGITVANCPNVNNEDVADFAVGLLVALVRDIPAAQSRLLNGEWTPTSRGGLRPSLRQLKAGIVGMGAIGKSIAARLPGFGMKIAWWGPNAKPEIAYPRAESVLALARDCDVLIMAGRADASSRKLISAEVIEAIGPKGFLVNISRGFTVDEEALIAALKDGRIGGAALDVFEEEPTPVARWRDVPNVVLTPHIGGAGMGAVQAQTRLVLENLALHFAGKPVKTPVDA